MTSTAVPTVRPSFSIKLLAGGIVAGLVMAMWEMMMEAILPGGNGFWSPVVYIGATVVRDLQSVTSPVPFHLLGVMVGMMGHMMNSIIFGLIFAYLIAPRARTLGKQIAAGLVYGVVIYLVMWFVVVPLLDPPARRLPRRRRRGRARRRSRPSRSASAWPSSPRG